jgi:hypothetical protein
MNIVATGSSEGSSSSFTGSYRRRPPRKEIIMLRVLLVILGCVWFSLSAGTSYANCDNSSLNGVYPFTASGYTMGIYDSSGTLHYLNPPQPISSVGQYAFDGQGNFTRVDYNVGNGVPVNNASTPVNDAGFRTGQTGTYAIADDCTGAISLNANGAMIALQVVVVDYGLSARAIVKSDHVPGFANPPDGTSCTGGCDEGVNILVDLRKDVYRRR